MKAKTHADITHFAINLLCSSKATNGSSVIAEGDFFRDAAVKGVKAEDHCWVPKRLLNWHFYPSNVVLEEETRKIMGQRLRPTSRWILKQRQEELFNRIEQGKSAKKIYKSFGRVIHHIQDMSTPSHVVPVYHAHSPADPFETYLANNWNTIEPVLQPVGFEPILGQSAKNDEDYIPVYDNGAERVLGSISTESELFPIILHEGSEVTAPASAFWNTYDQTSTPEKVPLKMKGFGSFGVIGEGFEKIESYQVGEELIPIDPKVYLDVAVFYMKFAIEDTIRAINKFVTYHR